MSKLKVKNTDIVNTAVDLKALPSSTEHLTVKIMGGDLYRFHHDCIMGDYQADDKAGEFGFYWVISDRSAYKIIGIVDDNYDFVTNNATEITTNTVKFYLELEKRKIVPVFSLAENKIIRYQEIDQKTGELIASGFTYDSQIFSLSSNAQANWNALKNQKTSFTFPKNVTTINSNTYSLTEINVDALWDAGKLVVDGYLDSGRALKKSIFDAIDQAAVDLVIDTR